MFFILGVFASKAQDPELLMNEFRAISLAAQSLKVPVTGESFTSLGVNTGATISLMKYVPEKFRQTLLNLRQQKKMYVTRLNVCQKMQEQKPLTISTRNLAR